jgi:hypothetical protein
MTQFPSTAGVGIVFIAILGVFMASGAGPRVGASQRIIHSF